MDILDGSKPPLVANASFGMRKKMFAVGEDVEDTAKAWTS
jgi:hypothetical protein